MPLTYVRYLKLDQLLDLQELLSEGPEHDEMLFIVIHQVYELWFKQVVHELDKLHACFLTNRTPRALHTLKRILTIFKTLVGQVDILETMTPLSFSSFRTRLESASGFQSFQFREIETILGMRSESQLQRHPHGTPSGDRLKECIERGSLYDAFLAYIDQNGYPIPESALARDRNLEPAPNAEVQEVLLQLYRNDFMLGSVCERLVDLDEGLQEWRYRHVKMVERTIGTKIGTGGSDGASYLRNTLFRPIFPDLWAIRQHL